MHIINNNNKILNINYLNINSENYCFLIMMNHPKINDFI